MNGGHKEGTHKQKGKESPLCCIDGHPPYSKVRVHPGECSQEKFQVWNIPQKQLTWMVKNILNRYTIEELGTDEAGIRAEIFKNWDTHQRSG